MYRMPSKRKQLIARIVTYSLMSISVIVIALFLIAIILGYRFNGKAGRIEQSGLVQYNSTPSGAQVSVDGIKLGARTATSNTVLPGQHTFMMQREGYEVWQKALNIRAGTLTALNYARLVPISRPVKSVMALPQLDQVKFSPKGRFALVHAQAASPDFTLYDLGSDNNIKQTVLTLPAASYSEADTKDMKHTFAITEWDSGGRYVLIKHTYNDAVEWLVLDTTDVAATANITQAFHMQFDEPHFSGTSGNVIFALSNGDIRKIDRQDGTVSRPLASQVQTYDLYSTDIITYTTMYDVATGTRSVGLVRDGDKDPYILRTTKSPLSVPLHVATARYFNQNYVVISEGTKVDILAGDYPTSPEDTTSLKSIGSYMLDHAPEFLTMSYNGRFILAQTGDKYTTYDLERSIVSPENTIAGSGATRQLDWLDDFYLWSDRAGNLTIGEFDGTNQHDINPVASGFDATLSPSSTYLYSIGKAKDGYDLQRVRMIL